MRAIGSVYDDETYDGEEEDNQTICSRSIEYSTKKSSYSLHDVRQSGVALQRPSGTPGVINSSLNVQELSIEVYLESEHVRAVLTVDCACPLAIAYPYGMIASYSAAPLSQCRVTLVEQPHWYKSRFVATHTTHKRSSVDELT